MSKPFDELWPDAPMLGAKSLRWRRCVGGAGRTGVGGAEVVVSGPHRGGVPVVDEEQQRRPHAGSRGRNIDGPRLGEEAR